MKRAWTCFCGAALLAELCSTWLQSFHHAADVPFAVTYGTRFEYVTDRLIIWAAIFIPLMIVAVLFSRRNSKL